MQRKAIVLHHMDNVASALTDLEAGQIVTVEIPESAPQTIALEEDLALGHKFALWDIAVGADVIKYGVPIGQATRTIRRGEHVHTHNLR